MDNRNTPNITYPFSESDLAIRNRVNNSEVNASRARKLYKTPNIRSAIDSVSGWPRGLPRKCDSAPRRQVTSLPPYLSDKVIIIYFEKWHSRRTAVGVTFRLLSLRAAHCKSFRQAIPICRGGAGKAASAFWLLWRHLLVEQLELSETPRKEIEAFGSRRKESEGARAGRAAGRHRTEKLSHCRRCHARERGHPSRRASQSGDRARTRAPRLWIPAFAGMTDGAGRASQGPSLGVTKLYCLCRKPLKSLVRAIKCAKPAPGPAQPTGSGALRAARTA